MDRKILIAPSILSADFANLGRDVELAEKAGADMLHVDVMDGHFVPNITIGPCVVKALSAVAHVPLNVHLMIENPSDYIGAFSEAGSDRIVVHAEAEKDVKGLVRRIKALGREAGVSVKPKTGIRSVTGLLDDVDEILVMTVEPGFGGQGFMREVVPKIARLREIFRKDIAVDGGITAETAKEVVAAGANILVAGTAVFRAGDVKKAVAGLKAAGGR